MTPLALELLEDVYGGTFSFADKDEWRHFRGMEEAVRWLRAVLKEAKFFECTAVWPLAHMLGQSMARDFEQYDRFNQRLAFLPGVNTWIECEYPSIRDIVDADARINKFVKLTEKQFKKSTHSYRVAHVFVGPGSSTTFAQRWQIGYATPRDPAKPRYWSISRLPTLPLVDSHMPPQRVTSYTDRQGHLVEFDQPTTRIDDFVHYAHLSLINSPRIIGQRGHYPHGRAEREVLKKIKQQGKFPLRAWTEILLQVTPNPEDRSEDAPKEMHLTGERCLHYCRTYLRVRYGELEYVEGHWRGNPVLGVARSRYRVEPEKGHDTT